MFGRLLARIMSKGLTPIRLVLLTLVLGGTTAFTLNAAVEEKLMLLEALQWLLGNVPETP